MVSAPLVAAVVVAISKVMPLERVVTTPAVSVSSVPCIAVVYDTLMVVRNGAVRVVSTGVCVEA